MWLLVVEDPHKWNELTLVIKDVTLSLDVSVVANRLRDRGDRSADEKSDEKSDCEFHVSLRCK